MVQTHPGGPGNTRQWMCGVYSEIALPFWSALTKSYLLIKEKIL